MSKFVRAGFLIFSLVFVSRDLELGGKLCALQKFNYDSSENCYVGKGW